MAYRLPTFNIEVNIWRFGSDVTDPPDETAIGNHAIGRRVNHMLEGEVIPGAGPFGFSWILLPALTLLYGDTDTAGTGDNLEIPAGSGRWYHCLWSEVSALGFDNEHVVGTVIRLPAAPLPPGGHLEEEASTASLEDESALALDPE